MSDDNRPFPIQSGYYHNSDKTIKRPVAQYAECSIPWWLAEEAYQWYSENFGTSQSLETLAARGGFGREELLMLLRHEEV